MPTREPFGPSAPLAAGAGDAPAGTALAPVGRSALDVPPAPAGEAGLDDLLRLAVASRASDIHLTVESPPVFRIHGRLEPLPMPVLRADDVRALIEPVLTPAQAELLAAAGQVDFAYSVSGVGRFRVNAYRQRSSLSAALRVIPTQPPTLGDLDLPPVVGELARRQSGLILVVGPTSSGKSTTLAAIVDAINGERRCHVVTLEDPIEYLHRHKRSIVNQREVGTDVATFAGGLRAVLRQDPDVILVGEMRDTETAAIALAAAETGHLVLASLHTADAAQTVDRVVDMFPPHQQDQVRSQLAGSLAGIVAQALVPRLDGLGMALAVEVLVATPAVRNLIRDERSHQIYSAIQTGARHGMVTMESSLRRLLAAGLIAEEEYAARIQPERQVREREPRRR